MVEPTRAVANILILNAAEEADVLPGSFRSSRKVHPSSVSINLTGLNTLYLSGSAQFSEISLKAMKRHIGEKRYVTVLSLRQAEVYHIFPKEGKGAVAASYMYPPEDASELLTRDEITLYGLDKEHNVTLKATICPHPNRKVLTSKELVTKEGYCFAQIPGNKSVHVDYQQIDQFVNFVKELPPDEQLHIHTRLGKKRTTLFMAMYDMMKNALDVPFEDILTRQGPQGLGGTNLREEQLEFLLQFYTYCMQNMQDGFKTSFTNCTDTQPHTQQKPTPTIPIAKLGDAQDVTATPLVLSMLNDDNTPIRCFRTAQDTWTEGMPECNSAGLEDLPLSGSNQYSETAFALFMQKMKELGKAISVCDLRHEKHCFVNGMDLFQNLTAQEAVSNPPTPYEILTATSNLKEQIQKADTLRILTLDTKYPSENYDKKMTLEVHPQCVKTPQEMVTSYGANYLLIGNNRFSELGGEELDRFVAHVSSMPKNGWMHIHCRKGKTRTTAYMCFFDMLHNANKVSKKDIIHRQYAIGGHNLFDVTPKDPTWATEKQSKINWICSLARFHKYAKNIYIPAKKCGKEPQLWSEWSKEHQDYKSKIEQLVIDKKTQ